MKHITILVPNGDNNISSIAGAYKILMRANSYRQETRHSRRYHIQLAGMEPVVDFHGGLFSVKPHVNIADIRQTHLVIVPSLNHNYDTAIAHNQPIIEWLKTQYANGAELASVCTGAFLLAATGLLNGKSCSTHWAFANTLSNLYPDIDVQKDKLITDESGIYTNGGAYSFLNLIIYLVEKYFDRETAIFCSKVFQIEMDRQSQQPFIIFKGQKEHADEVVKQAQDYIETHFRDMISIEALASRFAVGRRNFDRRFIKATGNTPIEYAQRVKVEVAKKAFETSRKTINEVMYDVGYTDVKAFREVFKRITGVPPLDYRMRYNKVL